MKKLVKAVLQTLASSMAVQVLTMLAGVFLARILGPTGRGDLAATQLWPHLFFFIVLLGFGSSIQFLYPQIPEDQKGSMFGNILLVSLAVGVPGAILEWILMPFLLHSQAPYVIMLARIYALHLPMGLLQDYSTSLLLATQRFGTVSVLRVANSAYYLVGLVLIALAGRVSVTAVLVVLLLSGHASFVYTLMMVKRAGLLFVRPDFSVLKRCLKFALRTHLGTLCSLASGQGDRMLMAAFLPSRQLGLYSVAVSASMLPYPLVQAITTTLLPAVAVEDSATRRQMALRVVRITLPLLTVVFGTLIALADLLIFWLYGPQYAEVAYATRILLLGTVAFGAADVLRQAIRALDKPILASVGDVAGLGSTIGLLALWLPAYGYLGAAYASLGAYVLTYVVLVVCASATSVAPLHELLIPTKDDFREMWRAGKGVVSRQTRKVAASVASGQD